MEDSNNSVQLKDQLKNLLFKIKDLEQTEIDVDYYLQISNFTETQRDNKKV